MTPELMQSGSSVKPSVSWASLTLKSAITEASDSAACRILMSMRHVTGRVAGIQSLERKTARAKKKAAATVLPKRGDPLAESPLVQPIPTTLNIQTPANGFSCAKFTNFEKEIKPAWA